MPRFASSASVIFHYTSNLFQGKLQSFALSANQRHLHLQCSVPIKHVAHIQLSDAKTKNAVSKEMTDELVDKLHEIENNKTIRCVVMSGEGSEFCSGINVKQLAVSCQKLLSIEDAARRTKAFKQEIDFYQRIPKAMRSVLSKPIVSCVHGLCLGFGTALVACTDIRVCSADAKFSVREVKLAFASDVGSLQLMPKQFNNQSKLREFIYTGNTFSADEALKYGFVSDKFETKQQALDAGFKIAEDIAKNSPVGVQVSKINLDASESKSFEEGLEISALWNMSILQNEEIARAVMAALSKDQVEFEDY